MAHTLRVLESRDLRRVIGDGEAIPDGEVEGLSERDLLELYRWMVLLRTYDERSVAYHRQGRIGTYAIFWNHEAMQAGSVHALADEDCIFPSYRESAIGLLRGIPASNVLHWWRGHPAGWWNPAQYRVASICVPIEATRYSARSEEHTSELQSRPHLVCRLLLEKKNHKHSAYGSQARRLDTAYNCRKRPYRP